MRVLVTITNTQLATTTRVHTDSFRKHLVVTVSFKLQLSALLDLESEAYTEFIGII